MSNTLTRMLPDIYAALNVVSRELTGFIPAVTLDARIARAALNQDVVVPIAPAATAQDITPAVNAPNTGDQVIGNTTVKIEKSRSVAFRWSGEEEVGVNTGPGVLTIQQQQIAEGIRTLVNEIETYCGLFYTRASRAIGTAGTAPFGTPGSGDMVDVLKVLKDNGCPMGDVQAVIDTSASANLMKVANLYKANEGGGDSLIKQGIIADLYGAKVRESAGIHTHVKGGGASYQLNGVHALGSTALAVDTGTGTILAGDVLTIANGTPADTDKYVVGSALSGGTVTINKPGLRRSAHVDNDAVTLGNGYAANMVFARSAFILSTRAPAVPKEGDAAADRILVTDPRTGLTFEICVYLQYKQVYYEIGIAWGGGFIKPEHGALLLG